MEIARLMMKLMLAKRNFSWWPAWFRLLIRHQRCHRCHAVKYDKRRGTRRDWGSIGTFNGCWLLRSANNRGTLHGASFAHADPMKREGKRLEGSSKTQTDSPPFFRWAQPSPNIWGRSRKEDGHGCRLVSRKECHNEIKLPIYFNKWSWWSKFLYRLDFVPMALSARLFKNDDWLLKLLSQFAFVILMTTSRFML